MNYRKSKQNTEKSDSLVASCEYRNIHRCSILTNIAKKMWLCLKGNRDLMVTLLILILKSNPSDSSVKGQNSGAYVESPSCAIRQCVLLQMALVLHLSYLPYRAAHTAADTHCSSSDCIICHRSIKPCTV